jgi:MGT family glycosyltransferase
MYFLLTCFVDETLLIAACTPLRKKLYCEVSYVVQGLGIVNCPSIHQLRHHILHEMESNNEQKGTIVFFSMDAPGHIHPILSIVKELKRRGYRAIILTTRPLKWANKLEAMGIELAHCQENARDHEQSSRIDTKSGQTSEDIIREIMQPMILNFRKGIVEAYESTYSIDGAVGKHLDDMIKNHDTIESKLKSLKPDLIVYDHVIGIPCATTVARRWVRVYSGFPSALVSSIDDTYNAGMGLKRSEMSKSWKDFELKVKGPLRDKIRQFWQDKGVQDWPLQLDLTPTSPYLNFYLGPKELGLDQDTELRKLPDVWHRLEHTIDEDNSLARKVFELPEKLKEKPGKVIYFSLGTLVTFDTELINRLLSIFSKSPNKFIVSMGQMHKHIYLYDNMWGEMYVDQSLVLKVADLFITHGGHNSIIEAFYYGVPGLIVLPVFADQFDSAQRVEDCGFGIRLNPFDCTEGALLNAIELLLNNDDLKTRMQKISSRLKSIKYHEIAVDKLEQLITETD